MRVGVVLEAQPFPEARKPAIKLSVDFGPLGIERSSAQITERYVPGDLVGRRVIAVVNFPPKRIGPFVSEVLVLGAYGAGGTCGDRLGRLRRQPGRRRRIGKASAGFWSVSGEVFEARAPAAPEVPRWSYA